MWIFTADGFYSVVEKPADVGTSFLTVRARTRGDLVALLRAVPPKRRPAIRRDAAADYLYRARVRRGVVAKLLADAAMAVDYPNFKDEVKRRRGAARAGVYARVWQVLLDLERRRPFSALLPWSTAA